MQLIQENTQVLKSNESRSVIASRWWGAGQRDDKGAEETMGDDGYVHYCNCGARVKCIGMSKCITLYSEDG